MVNDPLPPEEKYPDYCRTFTYKDGSGHVKQLVLPKALDLDRPKRARTTFCADQLRQLEEEFNRNQYLVGRERTQLARSLHLTETQVKVWFQNRRTKYKRDRTRDNEICNSQPDNPLLKRPTPPSVNTAPHVTAMQHPAPPSVLSLPHPLGFPLHPIPRLPHHIGLPHLPPIPGHVMPTSLLDSVRATGASVGPMMTSQTSPTETTHYMPHNYPQP